MESTSEASTKSLHSMIESKNVDDVKLLLDSINIIERQKMLQKRLDGVTAIDLVRCFYLCILIVFNIVFVGFQAQRSRYWAYTSSFSAF